MLGQTAGGGGGNGSTGLNPKRNCTQCVGMLWRKCDEGDVCDVMSLCLSDTFTRQQSPDVSDVCVVPQAEEQ